MLQQSKTNSSYCFWVPSVYWYCLIVILLIIYLLIMQVPLTNGGQWAISFPYVFWKYVASFLCWKFGFVSFSKASETNLAPALSKSSRGPCISYLDFLINADRGLFSTIDIRNDLRMIWFEAETRGIPVEEGFRLIYVMTIFPDHSDKQVTSQSNLFCSE